MDQCDDIEPAITDSEDVPLDLAVATLGVIQEVFVQIAQLMHGAPRTFRLVKNSIIRFLNAMFAAPATRAYLASYRRRISRPRRHPRTMPPWRKRK